MYESGISLYLSKMIFYLKIEQKVWAQRRNEWSGKDNHNTATCNNTSAILGMALQDLKGQLRKNQTEEKLRHKEAEEKQKDVVVETMTHGFHA